MKKEFEEKEETNSSPQEVSEAIACQVVGDRSNSVQVGSARDTLRGSVTQLDIQNIIEEFGREVQKFEFARASKIIDDFRQKKLLFTSTPEDLAWGRLLNALSEISNCDCKYYQMAFLHNRAKTMFRKEVVGCRSQYEAIAKELEGGAEKLNSVSTVVSHLLDLCRTYVLARLEMILLYDKMTLLVTEASIDWSSMEHVAITLRENLRKCHHPDLAGISHLFQEEVEILRLLFTAQIHISNCRMFESLLELKQVRENFDFWIKELGSLNPANLSFFAKILGGEPVPRNRLIQWLIKFYDLLMAKFSLYFTNVLEAYCGDEDRESIHSIDNKFNFIDSFRNIQAQIKACRVGIIMDRSFDGSDFYGFGYLRKDNKFATDGYPIEPLKGVCSKYPFIFQCPNPTPGHQRNPSAEEEHGCIEKFIKKHLESRKVPEFRGGEDGEKPNERKELDTWRSETQSKYVYGDHLEGQLFIVAILNHPLKATELGEFTKFVYASQAKLRGSDLLAELRQTAR
ncbi:unnamed protein product [Auanema sp. JU1783]|nr:unnamed protein product [Auanema sp. JU1783]